MRTAKALILLSCMQPLLLSSALAGTGGVINLPMGTAPKNGLRLDIDTYWVNSNGYRPLRITATNLLAGPTSPDRTIRVELTPRSWRWGDNASSVTAYIEIPEKTARVQQIVSIPQSNQWTALIIEVYEDGQRLKDMSAEAGIPRRNTGNWRNWSEATPTILIVDSDAPPNANRQHNLRSAQLEARGAEEVNRLPDIRYLAVLNPDPNDSTDFSSLGLESEVTDRFTLQFLDQLPKVEMRPPSDLPTKWIDYTCFDLTFVSWDDLNSLVNSHPDKWRAIRDWVATGPTLCVYDMPLDAQPLKELEELLELPSITDSDGEPSALRGWSLPDKTQGGRQTVQGLDKLYQPAYRRGDVPDQSSLVEILAAAGGFQPATSPTQTAFVTRDVNLGRVVAMRTNEPFRPGPYGNSWLMNEIGDENWMWYRRHGMSLHRENKDYWNLMIPGVGSAPVTSYLVLITLFVVVIGPVNYYFLRKRKRLYLLLITVPVGAGLVTFALLNYALISDGLGTRARVRSFTEIDQTTGRAVSWSRQTYYAGLAPSRGLHFPTDAAFYTVEPYPSERRRSSDRWLDWDEGQRLTSGYLGARSTAQFMVVRSHKSRGSLGVNEPEGSKAAPRVTNNFKADVAEVLICDSAGRYHWAENIEAGKQFQPQPIQPSEAAKRLRSAYDENRPTLPVGFDPRYYRSSFGFGRSWWSDIDQNLQPPVFAQGILERGVQRAIYTEVEKMKPRTYIVITETSAEAPLAHEASREEASFHVISGRW